jgi:hypothetical protein
MKQLMMILALGSLLIPGVAFAQQPAPEAPASAVPAIPPTGKCSASRPCHQLTGEVVKIEESYWIKDATGQEIHMKVTRDTKMDSLPRLGEKITAEVTSNGEAQAIMKTPSMPVPPAVSMPSKDFQDLRK